MDAIAHAATLFSRHKRALGYVMTRSLETAAARGELYVSAHAAAYVWRRRDATTTLHAIVSEARGEGAALLARITTDSRNAGHTALLARCPVDNVSNDWYQRRGFTLARTEAGKARAINVWMLAL